MNENFMKEKPVFPLLVSMALPMVISMLVNSLYNIVDSFFVAQISEDAMTALSLVYPVQNFVNAVAIGFGIGLNAVISYYLGAGDKKAAGCAATQGLALTMLHAVILTIGSLLVIERFLRMFSSSETVIDLGVRYSRIIFLFTIAIMANLYFEKVFQAVGRMKVTMTGMMVGCIVNIILDPLIIFGIGPFPRLGIEGAALATGIGQVTPVVIYWIIYKIRPISVKIRLEYLKEGKNLVGRLYAIGVPAILNLALPSLLISALNGILAVYSQSYVVVLGIYYKLQTFIYLTANGIVQGMRPIIGFNYGAGEHKRVRKIYECGDHAYWNRHLPCHSGTADRTVQQQSGDHPSWRTGTDTHQRGLFDFGSFHHILRCAGGTRKRRIFPDHFPLPKCHCHSPGSLPAVPSGRRRFRMARLLDHRGHFRSGFSCGIPPRSTKIKNIRRKEKRPLVEGGFSFYNR